MYYDTQETECMINEQKQARILMIDDDSKLISLLSDFFPLFQMEFLSAPDALSGIKMIREYSPHMVILDVMMPGMDGFEACREIRNRSNVPIIMLSARGEAMDRIVGLELGADDYMSKPFEPRELVTRIQAILRRSTGMTHRRDLIFGDLEIHFNERESYLSGKPMGLTSMEFELLHLLVTSPGRKFSRDELMNHLQGFYSDSFSRSIDILISRLRSKLGENARNPKFIKSVHGFGYVFIGENT